MAVDFLGPGSLVMPFPAKTKLEGEGATKTENGQHFPSSNFAYAPDKNNPSTWKLRLTSTPGGKPDPHVVGAAVAALGKGFRGRKVQIPAADLPAVKRKVLRAWHATHPDATDEEIPRVLRAAESPQTFVEGVAPKGWEETIKRMKKSGKVSNPWALAYWMRRRGYTPHKASDGEEAAKVFEARTLLAERLMCLELNALVDEESPGLFVRYVAEELLESGEHTTKRAMLYAEKPDGFSCRSCTYSRAANGSHGSCALIEGTIQLDQGCCIAWAADLTQLQIHKDF